MANKTYLVMRDGMEIRELKTLAAAKKLADAEGGEVVCEGEVVYAPVKDKDTPLIDHKVPETYSGDVDEEVSQVSSERALPTKDEPAVTKYRLKALMNVRRKPSINSDRLRLLPKGTVVDVVALKDDWLRLKDGTFILYQGGQFAEKI